MAAYGSRFPCWPVCRVSPGQFIIVFLAYFVCWLVVRDLVYSWLCIFTCMLLKCTKLIEGAIGLICFSDVIKTNAGWWEKERRESNILVVTSLTDASECFGTSRWICLYYCSVTLGRITGMQVILFLFIVFVGVLDPYPTDLLPVHDQKWSCILFGNVRCSIFIVDIYGTSISSKVYFSADNFREIEAINILLYKAFRYKSWHVKLNRESYFCQ